jgi:hypothetical protein
LTPEEAFDNLYTALDSLTETRYDFEELECLTPTIAADLSGIATELMTYMVGLSEEMAVASFAALAEKYRPRKEELLAREAREGINELEDWLEGQS